MMDNLNLKPQSPDEVKTMMWTGENQREMFDLLTCGKKIDDYMTASGENFFIDHSTVKGGLVLIANIGNQCGCKIPVKIGDYVCGRRYGDKWCFSVADGTAFENNTCGTLEKREGKEKPIDIFKNQEQLEERLREWQHRLFLDGWLILAHVKDKIMNPIYSNLKDNTIEDGTPFIQADTIDEAVDYMVSNGTAGLVIFWVVWVILIGAAVFGFCYFDNKWLED